MSSLWVLSIYRNLCHERDRSILYPSPLNKKTPNPQTTRYYPARPTLLARPDVRSSQMQNHLDTVAEAQAASEKQLADVQSAIAAELAARPESVNFIPSSKFPPGSDGWL